MRREAFAWLPALGNTPGVVTIRASPGILPEGGAAVAIHVGIMPPLNAPAWYQPWFWSGTLTLGDAETFAADILESVREMRRDPHDEGAPEGAAQ